MEHSLHRCYTYYIYAISHTVLCHGGKGKIFFRNDQRFREEMFGQECISPANDLESIWRMVLVSSP